MPAFGHWCWHFIAALSIKAALIDPFATVALIQVYDKVTAGQTPNPEWSAKLESISSKFRSLVDRARQGPTTPPTDIAYPLQCDRYAADNMRLNPVRRQMHGARFVFDRRS